MAHNGTALLQSLIEHELESADLNIAKVSVALGAVETPLTRKDAAQQTWPADLLVNSLLKWNRSSYPFELGRIPQQILQAEVEECLAIFQKFVADIDKQLSSRQLDLRGKVKLVADSVWSKLTGVFVNDVLHVQVSEDHCWLNTDPEGKREGTIEVTVDNAAKRALPVNAAAWQGWLYSGGHAPLCSRQMTVTAMITSMNPSITARQNSGQDSEEMQSVQRHLLQMLQTQHPDLMYPAALGCLADLTEIQNQDALDQALSAQNQSKLQELVSNDEAQKLFDLAIKKSLEGGLGEGRQWYPHTYMFGYLMRRADFVVKQAMRLLGEETAMQHAEPAMHAAMQSIGSQGGAAVLRHYRYMSTDEQLYKDIEGVLEQACDMFKWRHQHYKQLITQPEQLTCLLEFWDGVCHLYTGKAKPSHWVASLLKTLKLFTPFARERAVSKAETSSAVMTKASVWWEELKVPRLKALFETADVADNDVAANKRQKRSGTHRFES